MKKEKTNHHLHFFDFYHESDDTKYIENNLTRALALCLKQDNVLLFAFLKELLSAEDFNYLFYTYDEDTRIRFDMQVETRDLVDETKKLYAIGLTDAVIPEDWSSIIHDLIPVDKKNFTDLVISIKDLTIIVEVKRHNENCKEQLLQQIAPFLEEKDGRNERDKITVTTRHFCWASIITMMEQIGNFHQFNGTTNQFISSFFQLIRSRFNHWIPTKPFKFINLRGQIIDPVLRTEINRRLHQSLHSIGEESVRDFWDRTAIVVNRPWASEAIPEVVERDSKFYVQLTIWPGNVKSQGNSMYNAGLNWINNTTLNIRGESYELDIERHIKFMHFNKFITGIDIPISETDEMLKKEINTTTNHYYNIAGRWAREDWDELDDILMEHFKFNWKEYCGWEEKFEDTDRSYLTVSLGFAVSLYISFEKVQEIDKDEKGYEKVGEFINACKDAMVAMIDGVN